MAAKNVHQVECDTCSCAPSDPGIWHYEDQGWCICQCSCHQTLADTELRLEIIDFAHDLATREFDPQAQAEAEEARWTVEEIDEKIPRCKFCQGSLDFEPYEALRKVLPMKVHSRMSFGVSYDKDGKPYHEAVWQCIEVYRKRGFYDGIR